MPQKILKIGHRGAAGYEPENTLLSFRKAMDLGVDAIELDVYCCKSGELVVIHDDRLERTTNGQGYVWDKDLSELKVLDAGKGQRIPTLIEVLDLIAGKIIVNIELKGARTAKPVAKIIKDYLKKPGWTKDNFIVSSFNHVELKKFMKIMPSIKTGALMLGILEDYAKFAQKLGVDYVNLGFEFINKEFVSDAHKRGLKVFVWTPNFAEDIERAKKLKVDGIFSNYPDKI